MINKDDFINIDKNDVLTIAKGDIITIIENKKIEYPGGKWHDHFVPCKKHLLVKDTETNNGFIKAIDSRGEWYYHIHRTDVIAIKVRKSNNMEGRTKCIKTFVI